MSGLPFNAMWTAPPPPSYTDVVSLDPTDYVVLTTSRGDEALVHKDCLVESPVLRFCFRKREPLNTPEVVVEFVAKDAAAAAAAAGGAAASPTSSLFLHTRPSVNEVEGNDEGAEDAGEAEGGDDGAPRDSLASAALTSDEDANAARHRVTLTESLCTDNSVKITFPRLTGPQLETVVAYLYFKHHYNGRPAEARPRFDIPASAALEVMRVAKTLKC